MYWICCVVHQQHADVQTAALFGCKKLRTQLVTLLQSTLQELTVDTSRCAFSHDATTAAVYQEELPRMWRLAQVLASFQYALQSCSERIRVCKKPVYLLRGQVLTCRASTVLLAFVSFLLHNLQVLRHVHGDSSKDVFLYYLIKFKKGFCCVNLLQDHLVRCTVPDKSVVDLRTTQLWRPHSGHGSLNRLHHMWLVL